MSLNTYLGIGAFIVLVLMIVAITRKKKNTDTSNESVVEMQVPTPQATSVAGATTVTPISNQHGFAVSENAAPVTPPPDAAPGVEVLNQTDFQVFVTQQGIRATLLPQSRLQMDSRFPLTVAPASPENTLHSVVLQGCGAASKNRFNLVEDMSQ